MLYSRNQIKKKLEKNLASIRKLFNVSELGIFGSFVKGSQQDGSDIDVLVTFVKGHKDFFNYMRLQYYLEDLLKEKIDLVIKDAVKPRLKGKILSEVEYV